MQNINAQPTAIATDITAESYAEETVLSAPMQHLSAMSLLTEQERQLILVDWNTTTRAYPLESCLHQLFEAQVERTPDSLAVLFEGVQLSYQELNIRANQLAHYLRHLGVGPDVLVGVSMERSLEMIIGLLAILKAGGAYVPLDPTYPPERLAFMLEDLASDATTRQLVLLTQSHLLTQLPAHSASVFCLDTDWRQIAQEGMANPACLTTANDLAYVIYTSGSTGKPKGAMNTHRGICNRLLWMQETYQLTEADAVLQKTPFSFDVSVWEFFWPLLAGARLVIARPEGHKDSAYLLDTIWQQQITTLHFVPSMLQVFLEEPGLEECSSLRQVMCSGESLSYELQERFFARHPAALHNLYGPTEAAIDVTFWACQRDSERHIVPIGHPIANTQLYILNRDGQPVPVGVQGELYIGGVGVARGYLNRPELTAERFVHDPFSTSPGAHLYRTGDIARYLPDGAIECLGRLDQQIKLRGFRIELGEIEAVLAHHPAVRETVVTVREDIPGDKRLIAYVVYHKTLHATIAELQRYMQQQVPPYMVPSAFVELSAFPLNTSGKVDRRALPAPQYIRPDLSEPFIAPRTPLEEIIAETWSRVLGVSQVGIADDFFTLGGHSLLAMRVATELRGILQVELPLRDFFAAPTVAQLAERVGRLKADSDLSPLPPLRALPRVAGAATASRLALPQNAVVLPASFAQQRLWFLDQLEPANPAYNIPATMHFQGQLNVLALQQSLTTLVQCHEVLRTTFKLLDGQAVQAIAPATPVILVEVDLQWLYENEREAALQQELMRDANQPFDLVQGPLWRVTLFHLAPERYALFLLIHHIIADGWSIGIFFQELTSLYTAFCAGQSATLPALPIQYADFASWQHAYVQGSYDIPCINNTDAEASERTEASPAPTKGDEEKRLSRHVDYWRQQFVGALAMLELPTDYPRPAKATHRGAAYTFSLPAQLTESLKLLSRQEGVTLYIVLVAAFQVLLYRYTGQEDLIIGTAIADRRLPEVQGLLGLFLNTVALRTNFAGDPTVRDILMRVREVVLDAHAHQDLPFEQLVQELNAKGQSNPLFQVSIQLDPTSTTSSEQWTLTRMSTGTGASKFDLSLELDEHPAGLIGHLEYKTDLFSAATIARMAAHWQNLLAAMVAEPTRTIASLTMLTPEERDRLLVELNTTSMAYPVKCCFHQLFEEQVSRTPSRIAAVFEGSQLTYQELNARANQLASYLRALHVGPDVLVGIYMERSLEMLIALLGILKAGGAYLPLDPSYPMERLAFMLEDAGVAVLITQQALVAQLPSHHASVVCIDADQGQFVHLSEANLTTPVTSSHLAYVIYTSGSTGRPKGVQISHRALLNLLLSMCHEPGISAQDTLLAVTTLSFDIAGLELYLPLIVGARLIIASRDVATNGRALAKALADAHATIMQATPVTWHMLLTSGWLPDPRLKILCGGEALSLELARQLLQKGSSLYNMYGPTETTIWSTLRKIEPTDTTISIGHPIANTTIYILDRHLQPVPVGVPGDLYIGGDGLARGYLHRPALTAERFVRHPFSANPADRIYRTGDVARYQSDGAIELLGRADQQIKLRGFRIELGEIESILGQHPAVEQAVAIVREDHPGDTYLAAYLVLRAGLHITIAELRQHLSQHLPDYMLPSAFMLLDRLPQTPNGKLDRRALPVPDHVSLDRQDFIAPRTSLEEVVAGIWSRVLGIERIGIHDNFFALGGHSLLAMQVASQFHTAFQVDLPLRTFFDAPTVAQIAAVITQQPTSLAKKQLPALHALTRQPRPDRTLVFPTTSAQQSLWFIDQLGSGNTAYNLPVTLHLYRPLHTEALKRSLEVLVRRHEALRTTFTVIDEQPMQVVAEHLEIPVMVKNLQHVSASEQSSMVLRLATQELQRPFDLAQGPLLRATVFHLNAEEYILLLALHHIIADGWSISLLLQEFAALYEAFLLGESVALPDLPLQFGDFAAWQREWRQSELINEHLSYWKEQLAGAPTMLTLSTDHPRPAQATHHGAMHIFALSAELRAQLKALSQQENVTLYMTLVAAFLVLLQRYSHQDDLLLGTTTAGRTFAETQPVFGYFINTLVLRADLSGNPTVHELLGRVREVTLAADAHQHLPFDMLVRELQLERTPGQSPLFQVFLTLDPPLPELAPGYDSRQLDLATGASKFDLSLELADGPPGIIGHLEYSSDLFDAPTIARMAEHWKTLLQAMADNATRRISELPLLTDAERQQILFEWNATQIPYCRADTLPQLFEAQVERTPDAIAVVFDTTALTYRSLNAQANQVARYLRQRGMQAGTRVAICYERSQELIIALLGILKTGSIYVPLDPAYPVERLAFMLADSQAATLITQQHLLERLFGALSGDAPGMPIDLMDGARAIAATTLASWRNNMICLDREWSTIAQESQENLACFIDGESPAYILYTSGSTGTPKGVSGTHCAALNRFNWMWRTYPFAPDEVCCQKTTLSFVDAVWEIFGPLLQGIKTVIIPEMVVKDPAQFLQVLAAHSVTRVVLVPSLLRALLDVETAPDQHLPDLRYWICSGEALSLELVRRFQQQLPARLLLNLYGSSEVAADATCYEVKSATELVNVPIGRPIDNTQIYLLDRHMQLVPIGIPGELHISGDGLAPGYFNRPTLTATKFVPHPFVRTPRDSSWSYGASEPGAILYKTGDWARYLPDGTIEYLGRLDHQVKLRGMRVELGEIEAVLKQLSAIREALVLAYEAAPDDQRLVAYIVLHEGQVVADDRLRQHLAQRLPPHMLPSAYIQLDALPLTPNGKVDRHALPAPDQSRKDTTATYVGPQLAIHHQLIQIWEELLNVRPVSIRDNFFILGGHSLLAARLMARIERIWGKRLPLSILFAGATIEHLATALLNETHSGNSRAPIVAVNAGGTKRPFFFLHGDWQGQGLYCLQLSQALGEDHPFYVLETYRYDHLNVLPTFEEVAAAHLAAIQSIQPEGPYTLGGWCNGALFAYEIAQQLHAAGQKVDTLVLMDPGSASPSGRFLRKAIRQVSHSGRLEQKQQVDWFLRFLHIYEYARLWKERRKHIAIQQRTESEGTPAEVEAAHPNFQSLLPPIENLRQNYLSIFNWWAASYKITPYAGRIAVFWTKEDDARRRKDWQRILAGRQGVEIYMVPGTHVTSRTRYARDLAKSLRDCLDK